MSNPTGDALMARIKELENALDKIKTLLDNSKSPLIRINGIIYEVLNK